MAQHNIGNIDPNETSGVELAALLSNHGQAVISTNLGAGRPTYAVKGTFWVRDSSATTLELFIYSGTNDVLIGTINTTTNVFTPAGGTINLAGLGGVPTGRTIATEASIVGGGNLAENRVLRLLNDSNEVPGNYYYGTNQDSIRGWFPLGELLGRASAAPRVLVYAPGDYTLIFPAGVKRVLFKLYGGSGGAAYWQTSELVSVGSNEAGAVYENRINNNSVLGGAGAALHGSIAVIPGVSYALKVGSAGADTVDSTPYAVGSYIPEVKGTKGNFSFIYGERFTGGAGQIAFCDGGFPGSSLTGPGSKGVNTVATGENVTDIGPPLNPNGPNGYAEIIFWS